MAKGMMIIDGQRVSFDGEKNVLSVIRKAGIEMPTFCYYSDLSVYGACRMCVVENEETGKIDASCSMEPRNGMRIRTNSARLLKHRRMILELLLASHNCNCTTCEKSGHCHLQTLAQQFGVRRIRFEDTRERYEIDNTSPAVLRDPNKCILCGDCVRVCEEMQGMGILNFAYRGSSAQVMPAFDRKMAQTKCVSCGQCAAVCPTGAITVKNQIGEAWRAIHDPKKRVVIQIAPAVRVAVGEAFGIPAGENVLDKLVTALKLMGVDEVYDTTFGADFTTIAESEEFLERLKNGGPFPMFTSCCPAWSVMAKKGMEAKEIVDRIESLKPYVRASFVVDTLKYLHRGGRCSATSALVGSVFKIKPRIYVENGKMDAGKKYRGKIEKVILQYVHEMEQDLKTAKRDRVFITQTGCSTEVVKSVKDYLKNLNYFKEIIITNAGGVISSHCGPGTLGVLFIAGGTKFGPYDKQFDTNKNGIMEDDERTEEAAYIRHMVEQENIENSQEDDSDDEYERQYDN